MYLQDAYILCLDICLLILLVYLENETSGFYQLTICNAYVNVWVATSWHSSSQTMGGIWEHISRTTTGCPYQYGCAFPNQGVAIPIPLTPLQIYDWSISKKKKKTKANNKSENWMVQGHPWLRSKFKGSLVFKTTCLKNILMGVWGCVDWDDAGGVNSAALWFLLIERAFC